MTVIKPKGSFSIQWRVVGWGYLWASCKPYIQWVALKTRGGGCLSRCPNSSVFSVVSAQPIHPAKCLSIMRLVHIVTCGVCKREKDVCDEKRVESKSWAPEAWPVRLSSILLYRLWPREEKFIWRTLFFLIDIRQVLHSSIEAVQDSKG